MQFLFMALYCTVKWKCCPGRVSSTYKMHEMGWRKSATQAEIYDSNRQFSACWLHHSVEINSSRSLTEVFCVSIVGIPLSLCCTMKYRWKKFSIALNPAKYYGSKMSLVLHGSSRSSTSLKVSRFGKLNEVIKVNE